MTKLKIKSLKKKNLFEQMSWFLLMTLIMLASFLLVKPMITAQAQTDVQDEATQESTIQNIKKVIDKQVELGQNEKKEDLRQAYLAQVKRVSAETLTVINNDTNIVIPLSENLEIIKDDEVIDVEEIVVDDWMIVYSIIEEDEAIIKRLMISEKDFTQTERKIMLGTITELYRNNLLFDSRTGESSLNFLLDSDTQYLDLSGDEISLNDLYSELQCLIVAKIQNNDQWRASSIKTLVDLND